MLDGLAVTAAHPEEQTAVFTALTHVFPDLDYYDADIPLALRLAASWGLFPLVYAKITGDEADDIRRLVVQESAWKLEPTSPPLGLMTIEPDIPPFQATPISLRLALLPSRLDERVPVANRYFGVFGDGTMKLRGIEARRRDTAPWVAQVQQEILGLLTAVPPDQPLESCLPDV